MAGISRSGTWTVAAVREITRSERSVNLVAIFRRNDLVVCRESTMVAFTLLDAT